MKRHVEVFDPAMCCSSGVCGPSVDPVLLRVSSDLKWLSLQGVAVTRYNLAQQPQAFMANDAVKAVLAAEPESCLPIVLVDGKVMSRAKYPSREELARWLGLCATAATDPVQQPCCGTSECG